MGSVFLGNKRQVNSSDRSHDGNFMCEQSSAETFMHQALTKLKGYPSLDSNWNPMILKK